MLNPQISHSQVSGDYELSERLGFLSFLYLYIELLAQLNFPEPIVGVIRMHDFGFDRRGGVLRVKHQLIIPNRLSTSPSCSHKKPEDRWTRS